jgi:hypothetical protein
MLSFSLRLHKMLIINSLQQECVAMLDVELHLDLPWRSQQYIRQTRVSERMR